MPAPAVSPTAESLMAEVPALAAHARTATLLRPSEGAPGVRDSSAGGPLLWPEGKPWPVCRAPHAVQVREKLTDDEREAWQRIDRARREHRRRNPGRSYPVTEEDARIQEQIMAGASGLDKVTWERMRWVQDTSGPGVPMVPVLQLYARDAPAAVPWPDGADVLQMLWCPNEHSDPPGQPRYWGPTVALRYRSSSCAGTLPDPPRPDRADDCYLPRPCVLDPLEVTDLPDENEIPEDLCAEGDRWAEAHGVEYHRTPACRPGWKAGGWPSRHLTGLVPVDCSCGARMRLLLTVDSSHDGPSVTVGRHGELRVFTCPADPAHPLSLNIQ
ncbi:hypothetical protein [Streptomyces aureoversilis]|uniref:DUF1963 domain-containing protein n=1 Tax=Streptomyces aureoversilis TaxID=67277 RepID=A0ABV9ZS33_9ACTN